MSTLNGVNYTEMFVTDEQLKVIKAMRSGNDGCLKCEGISEIKEDDLSLRISNDVLIIRSELDGMNIQISYCPFCGKKL